MFMLYIVTYFYKVLGYFGHYCRLAIMQMLPIAESAVSMIGKLNANKEKKKLLYP